MVWAVILSFLAMIVGLLGVVFPFLPGVPVAWLGLFGFAYYTNFTEISVRALWIFGGLTLLTFLLDFSMPLLAARIQKTSKQGTAGIFLGTVISVAFLGTIGIVIGPLVGAFIGEMLAGRSRREAFRASMGALGGFMVGSAVKILIVFSMMIYLALKLLT